MKINNKQKAILYNVIFWVIAGLGIIVGLNTYQFKYISRTVLGIVAFVSTFYFTIRLLPDEDAKEIEDIRALSKRMLSIFVGTLLIIWAVTEVFGQVLSIFNN